MKNCGVSGSGHARMYLGPFAALAMLVVSACATGDSSATDLGTGTTPAPGGSTRSDASVPTGGTGSSSGGGSGLNTAVDEAGAPAGDDATLESGGENIITDDVSGDDSTGDDGASSVSPGDDGAAGPPPMEASTPPSYACVTTLASAPVCDSAHKYCLCTADTQCNSHGLNNGGCNSGKCSGGHCSGGNFADSAGCSVVDPVCNINHCPSGTACEGGPTSGWNKSSNKSLCGTALQCCWCTSDSACPVSGKCINDATQNQCSGAGPCTGSGTDFDGMHCQLASPGIPMCSTN
ncbi:MAG TPA: hypothetical protein VK762_11125 [Polyangiaceae bacterium]|nr:hypothetical protein [Polyangiaceae bacterium]